MKNILLLTGCLIAASASAQVSVQNGGQLFLSGTVDTLFINGPLSNLSGASLVNNGNIYVSQNLVNDQSSMTAGTGTLYLKGTAAQQLNGSQPFFTYNLVTDNSAGISLNNNLSIAGTHTFSNGIISTSALPNFLIYQAGSSYLGDADNRHVQGWVKKFGSTDFVFPVGSAATERSVAINNLSVTGEFNASYNLATTNLNNLLSPLVTVDKNEYWTINMVSGGRANVLLSWDNSKVPMPGYALADIRVAQYNGVNWVSAGGTAVGNTSSTGSISSNTMGSFGPLTFGSISYALPVTLLRFTATVSGGTNVLLQWTSGNEIKLNNYAVERSQDGVGFSRIALVSAQNQPGEQSYNYEDRDIPQKGTLYYRLKINDADGSFHYSPVAAVTVHSAGAAGIAVINPVQSVLSLNFQQVSGTFSYHISNIGGQSLASGQLQVGSPGTYRIGLPASIVPGIYMLQVDKPGFHALKKILVQ